MAFSDMDAAAELTKMSNQLAAMGSQLTTALIQIAEVRGEMAGMRRDLDRMHADKETASTKVEIGTWSGVALSIGIVIWIVAILMMIYSGGSFGG